MQLEIEYAVILNGVTELKEPVEPLGLASRLLVTPRAPSTAHRPHNTDGAPLRMTRVVFVTKC